MHRIDGKVALKQISLARSFSEARHLAMHSAAREQSICCSRNCPDACRHMCQQVYTYRVGAFRQDT